MKCHDESFKVEVKVFHGKQPYHEYSPHYDKDNCLCCFIPVKAGHELTIQAKVSGPLKSGHIDLIVDGAFCCSRAFSSKSGKLPRAGRTEFLPTVYCEEDKGDLSSCKMVARDLGDRSDSETTTAGSVGTIEVRFALSRDNSQTETHDITHATLQGPEGLKSRAGNAGSLDPSIVPTHEIEFVKRETLRGIQRYRIHRNHLKDGKGRPGNEPWVICRFFYRSQETIANNGLLKVENNVYSHSLPAINAGSTEAKWVNDEVEDSQGQSESSSGSDYNMGNRLSSPTYKEHTVSTGPSALGYSGMSTEEAHGEAVQEDSVASAFVQDWKLVTTSSGWTAMHPQSLTRDGVLSNSPPVSLPPSPSNHSNNFAPVPSLAPQTDDMATSTTAGADAPRLTSKTSQEEDAQVTTKNTINGITVHQEEEQRQRPLTPATPHSSHRITPPDTTPATAAAANPNQRSNNEHDEPPPSPSPGSLIPHKRGHPSPSPTGRRAPDDAAAAKAVSSSSSIPAVNAVKRPRRGGGEGSDRSVDMRWLLKQESLKRDVSGDSVEELREMLERTNAELELEEEEEKNKKREEKDSKDAEDGEGDGNDYGGAMGQEFGSAGDAPQDVLEAMLARRARAAERLAELGDRIEAVEGGIGSHTEWRAKTAAGRASASEQAERIAAGDRAGPAGGVRATAFLAALARVHASAVVTEAEVASTSRELLRVLVELRDSVHVELGRLDGEVAEAEEAMEEAAEDVELFNQY